VGPRRLARRDARQRDRLRLHPERGEALAGAYDLRELAYDPWNATQTATDLTNEGLPLVEVRQGYRSLSEPSKKFEELVRWMVNNAAIKRDPADNIKPDKSSAIGRIDGVVAAVIALSRAIRQPATSGDWFVASVPRES
jgi:phage terminase large subunit-like protein